MCTGFYLIAVEQYNFNLRLFLKCFSLIKRTNLPLESCWGRTVDKVGSSCDSKAGGCIGLLGSKLRCAHFAASTSFCKVLFNFMLPAALLTSCIMFYKNVYEE